MRTKVLVMAVVCLAWLRGWSQDTPAPNAASKIIALENAWSRAAESKDLKALDTLLDGGFVDVDPDGRLMTKAEVLADVKASNIQQMVTEGMTAHLYGNAAIVTGMFKMKGVEKGKPFLRRGRFTDTWVYQSGAWVCVASQGRRSCTEVGAGPLFKVDCCHVSFFVRARAKGRAEMWKLFPVFLLLLAAPRFNAQSTAQPAAGQSRILALENAWNQAVQQKDTAALEMLLGPELVYVDYDGKLMDKAEYLASVQSPSLQPERIVSESMNVHLYGAVAVVNGVYRENGAKKGKPYVLKERFTDTWVRRSESWVCVASQSTLILH